MPGYPQCNRKIMDLIKAQLHAFNSIRGEEKARREHSISMDSPYFSLHSLLRAVLHKGLHLWALEKKNNPAITSGCSEKGN